MRKTFCALDFCAENFLCKNNLPVKTTVHLKNLPVKASVWKSFCCVKTVLGKVSACKGFGVHFFWCSLCVQFSLSTFLCAKKTV